MWIVAKVNIKKINTFRKNLSEKIGSDIKFYQPKLEYHKHYGDKVKKFEKYILENYIFCFHKNFKKNYSINQIRFLKGLEYFLDGHIQNQNQIAKFIDYCKSFEDEKGYLTQSFFKRLLSKKAKFISGPFTNMVFEIVEKQKKGLKILVGNIVTTISDKNNYLYRPV